MAKLNINPIVVFAPFKDVLGTHWDKVVSDTNSFLGRIEKDIKSTGGEWSVTEKGTLKSKEGHEVQLPLNNPISILLRFGMQLTKIASKGDFGGNYVPADSVKEVDHCGVQAEIPKLCQEWVNKMHSDAVELAKKQAEELEKEPAKKTEKAKA